MSRPTFKIEKGEVFEKRTACGPSFTADEVLIVKKLEIYMISPSYIGRDVLLLQKFMGGDDLLRALARITASIRMKNSEVIG